MIYSLVLDSLLDADTPRFVRMRALDELLTVPIDPVAAEVEKARRDAEVVAGVEAVEPDWLAEYTLGEQG